VRTFMMVALALCATYLGFKWSSELKLEERFSAMRDGARGVCMTRGSDRPTPEQMQDKLATLAEELRVTLSDIEVTIEPLDPSNDVPGGAQVQAGFGGKLAMTGTVAHVRAQMFAKRYLWKADAALESRCVLERNLQRVLPPSGM
jgi:hypothetical protein